MKRIGVAKRRTSQWSTTVVQLLLVAHWKGVSPADKWFGVAGRCALPVQSSGAVERHRASLTLMSTSEPPTLIGVAGSLVWHIGTGQ